MYAECLAGYSETIINLLLSTSVQIVVPTMDYVFPLRHSVGVINLSVSRQEKKKTLNRWKTLKKTFTLETKYYKNTSDTAPITFKLLDLPS